MPESKSPRDVTKEEITANWQEVNKAKINEINGFVDLGDFQRYFRNTALNIIGARWVIIWKMIESNVGAKCRLTIRGFNDRFQYFGPTPERLVVPVKILSTLSLLNVKISCFQFRRKPNFRQGIDLRGVKQSNGHAVPCGTV